MPPDTSSAPSAVGTLRTMEKAGTENRLFISYSRSDSSFVRALYEGLKVRGIFSWVDWEDIPPSAEWMSTIRDGIDAADAFLIVLSPNSLASPVCHEELSHAVASTKRLVPLVRDLSSSADVPEELSKLNYIFARNENELPDAIRRLVEALTTDLDKLRLHARILVRAREWTRHGQDAGFLLRGGDLREAESWVASTDTRGPLPSPVHSQFILASQHNEREEAERWKRLYEQSLARQLAAQSQLLVDQRGTALPLAALLAVEAARRSPSLEIDQALRKALRLMPFRHRVIEGRKFDSCFWAESADRVAIVTGETIAVRTGETDHRVSTIAAGGSVPVRGLNQSPVIFSRSGARVAAIVGERTVGLWDADSGDEVARFECDATPCSLAMDSTSTHIAATLKDATTVVFNVQSRTISTPIRHEGPMQNVAMHPEAHELALGGDSGGEIWDLASQTRIAAIPCMGPLRIWYSPKGEYLALLQPMTFEVNLFHVPTRQLVFQEKRHVDLAFDAQDQAFAIASPEWDIGVYSLPKCERRFRIMHDDSVWRVAFSPDGRRLASVSKDNTVRVWDVEREGREVARVVNDSESALETRFSQDNQRLLLLKNGTTEIRDAQGFRQRLFMDPQSAVFALDTSPDGRQVAFGCRSGMWALMDYEEFDSPHLVCQSPAERIMGQDVVDIRFVGQSKLLVKRRLGSYQMFDLEARKVDDTFLPQLNVSLAAVSRRSGDVAVVTSEQSNEILHWRGEIVARRTVESPTKALAIAEGGSAICVKAEDGSVTVFDGKLTDTLVHIAEPFGLDVGLDPNGAYLAQWEAGDQLSRVRIVEVPSGKVTGEWTVTSRLRDLRFDREGSHVVLALADKTVQVWDFHSGVEVAAFHHEAGAEVACFTADSGMIASGGWDHSVCIWPWYSKMLIEAVCVRVGRNLTEAEWKQYLPGEPYRRTCDER